MDSLDEKLWHNVLEFVGNATDFRACEDSGAFGNILTKDDKLWALCVKECKPEHYSAYCRSNRELSLIPLALENIDKWQKQSHSVLLVVMGMMGWKRLLGSVLSQLEDSLGLRSSGNSLEIRNSK